MRTTPSPRSGAVAHATAAGIHIDLYTDPACPFAFSHEPVRWALRWRYGDALTWRPRMIGIADSLAEMEARGLTTALLAEVRATLAARYGMPIAIREPDRLRPTRLAALAVVATRTVAPVGAERLLRELRVLAMAGAPMDDLETVAAAARAAGLAPAAVVRWSQAAWSAAELAEDMAAARTPFPAARSLPGAMSPSGQGLRYTAPTYVLTAPGRAPFVIPGLHPLELYDVAIANLLPGVTRQPPPTSAAAVLDWAAQPLATAEVAAVLGVDHETARRELIAGGAAPTPGADGYWVAGVAAPGSGTMPPGAVRGRWAA